VRSGSALSGLCKALDSRGANAPDGLYLARAAVASARWGSLSDLPQCDSARNGSRNATPRCSPSSKAVAATTAT
jgi:hypothetical protein